jgi:hypothetical protein
MQTIGIVVAALAASAAAGVNAGSGAAYFAVMHNAAFAQPYARVRSSD